MEKHIGRYFPDNGYPVPCIKWGKGSNYSYYHNRIRIGRGLEGVKLPQVIKHELIHWYLCQRKGRRVGHTKEFWALSKKLRCGDEVYRSRLFRKRVKCPNCQRPFTGSVLGRNYHVTCICGAKYGFTVNKNAKPRRLAANWQVAMYLWETACQCSEVECKDSIDDETREGGLSYHTRR